MRAVGALLALTFVLTVPAFSQSDSQKSSPPQRTATSTGALAIEADVGGILFIDGQRRSAIVASKVTVFNLMPGQHIVELRDAKGNILWKDTVTVPKGEQVVQRISASHSVPTAPGASGPLTQKPGSPGSVSSVSSASAHYDGASVAMAIVQILTAGRSNFESIKGSPAQTRHGFEYWPITIAVPDFECWLRNAGLHWYVGCSRATSTEDGEAAHLAIVKALAAQLRTEGYSCESTRGIDWAYLQSFRFWRAGADPEASMYLRWDGPSPAKGMRHLFTTNFNVSVRNWRSVIPAPQPPLECDFSLAALRRDEFNPAADVGQGASAASAASEIDAVLRSGRYNSLPPAQSIGVAGTGQPSLSIQNQTAYELMVLMAGAVEKSLIIPAGGSQNVVLPAGTYRILGRVKAANVLPFFGTQDYASGGSYRESFYIK